ncbi:hypothetical protein Tco_1451053, partial [Tanacetum coccineum]
SEHEADVDVEPHINATEVATNTSQTVKHDVAQMLQRLVRLIRHNGKRFGFVNNPSVVRKIKILTNAFHRPWATWKEVDEASRKELWTRFKTIYQWDSCIEKEVYDASEAWLRKNFRGFMAEVRDEAKKKYT